ncbi:hypothetical protein [Streptomyces sp. NPDC088760]|uniref:hypothetical protein n=1 Tax=Streptomyces sp. NPDC088760 TaxID=3365890 RepID=UPI0037F547A7
MNADGRVRATGAGAGSAATRRGTGPVAAGAARVGAGVPGDSRAALPTARAASVHGCSRVAASRAT